MGPTALAGVQDPAFLIPTHPSSGRFIPVFVLDLETDQPLLLDRTEQVPPSLPSLPTPPTPPIPQASYLKGGSQAVAYDDMVIAVRTKGAPIPSHYQYPPRPSPLHPASWRS